MSIKATLIAVLLPASLCAQEPLSAIDWLETHSAQEPNPIPPEPPVAETAGLPEIAVSTLSAVSPPIGLVPTSVTGLPHDLWFGSDIEKLVRLIRQTPVRQSPAMQSLLYTLILSETSPLESANETDQLLLARIDRLMELGATDPAQALAEQADPESSPALFSRWFDAALLTGTEERACEVLSHKAYLAPGYGARIFCGARSGDWQTAALTLETAHALDVLPHDELDLLDRFLSPDIFEDAPPLPPPSDPDALTFRLYEAIGERLPSASLPRAFATADLRDVAGWKAQIEAAERLTRIGALSPNQLLGLYTARRPSASGSIWDRVAAIQAFDQALKAQDTAQIEQTLSPAWNAMRQAGLEVPFSKLFAPELTKIAISNKDARLIAWYSCLLSSETDCPPPRFETNEGRSRFISAFAQHDLDALLPTDSISEVIAEAFQSDVTPHPETTSLGEYLLQAIQEFNSGANGNLSDLGASLVALRSAGFEGVARQAALQLLILREN